MVKYAQAKDCQSEDVPFLLTNVCDRAVGGDLRLMVSFRVTENWDDVT
jgi:hypothetical protein